MTDDGQLKDDNGNVTHVSFAEHSAMVQKMQAADERAKKFEGQIADMSKKLEGFSGIDPSEYNKMRDTISAMNAQKSTGISEDDYAKLREEIAEETRGKWQGELDAERNAHAELKNKYRELSIVDHVMENISSKFNEDAMPFVKQLVRERCDRNEQGELIFKDGNGEIYSEPNKLRTLEEFTASLISAYPSLAKPDAVPGTKSDGQKVNSSMSNGITVSDFLRAGKEARAQIPLAERRKLSVQALNQK